MNEDGHKILTTKHNYGEMLKMFDNEANKTFIRVQTFKQVPDLTTNQTSDRSGYGCRDRTKSAR